MPEVTVEVAFGSGFRTPVIDRDWTDVSAYVEGESVVGISRGRGDEFSDAQPASCRVTLDNRDGRFTPGYASGAYYPNVRRYTPIRITVHDEDLDVEVDRFTGYITTWPVVWPAASDTYAAVTITCSVVLPRISQDPLRSMVIEEYLLDDPVACYPLNEPQTAIEAVDASANHQPNITAAPDGFTTLGFGLASTPAEGVEGVVGGVPTDNGPSAGVHMALTSGAVAHTDLLTNSVPAAATSFAFAIALRVSVLDDPLASRALIIGLRDAAADLGSSAGNGGNTGIDPGTEDPAVAAQGIWLDVNETGQLGAIIRTGTNGATKTIQNTGFQICDDSWHHLLVQITRGASNSTPTYYVDGVLVYTGATFANQTRPLDRLMLGSAFGLEDDDDAQLPEHSAYAHAGVWNQALASDRISSYGHAATDGFVDERTDQRFERIATYVGLEDLVTAEAGQSLYVPLLKTDGRSASELFKLLEKGEGGLLFDGRDGTLTMHSRGHRSLERTTITLSATAQKVGGDLSPVLDDFGLVNDITVTSTDPAVPSAHRVDEDSRDQNGPYTQSVQIPTTNADEVIGYAELQIARRAEPEVRIGQVTADLMTLDDADVSDLLALDVGAILELANLPVQAPASTMRFFVEGYSEEISSLTHRITFNLSPADDSIYWALDDTVNSILDQTTRLTY